MQISPDSSPLSGSGSWRKYYRITGKKQKDQVIPVRWWGYIAGGQPIKELGKPIFFEYLAAAIDKKAGKDPIPFVKKVTEIIQQMHSDGTLQKLSQQYYQTDLTTATAKFDVNALAQFP